MLSDKIKELYKITNELESSYPGRKFTIDGHLVGSIGEVIVAEHYGLELLRNSTETHDAVSTEGKYIQIKATQINRIAISSTIAHNEFRVKKCAPYKGEIYNEYRNFYTRLRHHPEKLLELYPLSPHGCH